MKGTFQMREILQNFKMEEHAVHLKRGACLETGRTSWTEPPSTESEEASSIPQHRRGEWDVVAQKQNFSSHGAEAGGL